MLDKAVAQVPFLGNSNRPQIALIQLNTFFYILLVTVLTLPNNWATWRPSREA